MFRLTVPILGAPWVQLRRISTSRKIPISASPRLERLGHKNLNSKSKNKTDQYFSASFFLYADCLAKILLISIAVV